MRQVSESNARILQKAAAQLNSDQLATLDSVLTKASKRENSRARHSSKSADPCAG